MTTELPSPRQRWTVRRKAAVIEAVRQGLVPIEKVRRAYNISVDEFRAWERDFDKFGVHGLRSTRVQIYRDWRLEDPLSAQTPSSPVPAERPDMQMSTLGAMQDGTAKDLTHLVAAVIQQLPTEKRAALAGSLLDALGITATELQLVG